MALGNHLSLGRPGLLRMPVAPIRLGGNACIYLIPWLRFKTARKDTGALKVGNVQHFKGSQLPPSAKVFGHLQTLIK